MERKQKDVSNMESTCTDIAQVGVETESPIVQEPLKGKNRNIKIEMVWDWDNLILADEIARKGKSNKYGVRKFDKHWWKNMTEIQHSIITQTYHTQKPVLEERYCDHKIRTLAKLSYYDHVVHHALMNVCEPIFEKYYYYESCASIKGRGIHYAQKHVRKWIDRNRSKQIYWSQLDFIKCYHHVKREKIYNKICRTFHNKGIRYLFRDVIWSLGNHNGLTESDGTEGMGIGFYPVQPLVNFYLSDMDRLLSSIKDVKIFRYCDNVLIVGTSCESVWKAVEQMKQYADNTLEQEIHSNIGVQLLNDEHPIDFVGYKFYTDHTHIRNRTKYAFKRSIKHTNGEKLKEILSSYKGWMQHADCLHLWQIVTGMKNFKELKVRRGETTRNGERFFDVPLVSESFLVNREIIVKDYIDGVKTKNGTDRICILVEENGEDKKFLTNNPTMKDILTQIKELDEFPFCATLRSRALSNNKTDYYFE